MSDNNKHDNKSDNRSTVTIIGGGLAGSECALQLAQLGYCVNLYEMRDGQTSTPAHKTSDLAELVCSNSFGSMMDYSAPGLLKWEAERLGSFILKAAKEAYVPAGMALGIDREIFSKIVTQKITDHPNITIKREIVNSLEKIPRPAIIATGPLTHENLANDLQTHFGSKFLFFFDAIAPIISADSINMDIAWKGDRWEKGTKDYINCPLTEKQYFDLIDEITKSKKVEAKDFEKTPYFEGCMPVEAIIERGPLTLKFGPASPKGLFDPKYGPYDPDNPENNDPRRKPFAVIQLRQENKEATSYGMVGFQTKMTYGEQKRIFSKIPGLEEAEFLKLGSMHRNLYINSTKKLTPKLSSRTDSQLFFAGQISGVEGYFESTCIGLLTALIIDHQMKDKSFTPPPRESAIGSLLHALTGEEKDDFQPTNINFGLLPPLSKEAIEKALDNNDGKKKKKLGKKEKRELMIDIAKSSFLKWKNSLID